MKKINKPKQFLKYIFLALGVFFFSVLISILTRMVLLTDKTMFGFSESQAALIASMVEGIVGAFSAAIVVYQLRSGDVLEEHQNNLSEAKFLFDYNQSFLQDEELTEIEQRLEQDMLRMQRHEPATEALITDENRQAFINYLVYLEGMAPLVLQDVLKLEHIDDLMAYRFFLAINNPTVQEDQLTVFPDYYRGCFKLYKKWKQYRIENGREIINEDYSLDQWEYFKEFSGDLCVRKAIGSDDFSEIAALIYKTDPYIYPAAFGSLRKAKKVLPDFLKKENNPFYKENIRVAVYEKQIAGIVVVLTERPKEKIRFEDHQKEYPFLPKTFLHAAVHYLDTLFDYVDENGENAYIACVCVGEKFRGKGIGEVLVKSVCREFGDRKIDLHVLCDNGGAIRLYERCGFQKGAEYDGYSAVGEKPRCLGMSRPKK